MAGNIATSLAAQRDLYLQLAKLARRQSEYVASGQTEELMEILSARARVIEQIEPLDKQLQPYKGRWQETLDTMSLADKQKIVPLLKEVQQLLADILAQDEADKESLVQQKQQVSAEISKTVAGAALNKAYGVKPRLAPGMEG